MNLANFKIGTKLGAAFAAMVITTATVGGFAALQLSNLHDSAAFIGTDSLPSVQAVGNLRTAANQLRRAEAELTIHAGTPQATHEATLAQAGITRMEQAEVTYQRLISLPEEKEVYPSFVKNREAYLAAAAKLRSLATGPDAAQTRALYLGESETAFAAMVAPLARLADINEKAAEAALHRAETVYAEGRNVLIAAVVAAMALAVLLAVVITRAISRPVVRAIDAAERVAAGDLSTRIEVDGRDEVSQLLRTLAGMQERLAEIVQSVRGNAESVATASAEIAQGNTDLSQRTEEQASALQQTSATMHELGSTVRNNADNARQANQLAQSAASIAHSGGEVVRDVVRTMKDIHESSRKISEITSLIDGIAFQTNILALNAAVEAARAGEQGRGFAVVAGEVRTLAQRSANAAKEIKSLITTSGEQVEQGTSQVDEAGRKMEEIVAAVRRVNDIAAEISAASAEQSTGVSQVGEAISQMDQVTQQNAALVEESAAAAESLKAQARQLVDAVAVFRLSDTGGVGSVAPRPDALAAAAIATARSGLPRATPASRKAGAADKAPEEWASF